MATPSPPVGLPVALGQTELVVLMKWKLLPYFHFMVWRPEDANGKLLSKQNSPVQTASPGPPALPGPSSLVTLV